MRRWAVVFVVTLTPVFVLAGRLPGLPNATAVFGGLPAEASIDYSRTPGTAPPLSDEYLTRLFGPAPNQTATPGARVLPRRQTAGRGGESRRGEIADSFSQAVEVRRLPFEGGGDTRAASREPDEPAGCGPVGGTVWYRYTPREDEPLVAHTFGSGYPTSLAVYRGASLSSLEEVACATNARGNSYVTFSPPQDVTHYFRIAGAVGGDLVFLLERAGITLMASPSDSGTGASTRPSISDDGRLVVFSSDDAMTARAHESCACTQIYVRDTAAGTTTLVSAAMDGAGGNAASIEAAISGNGRYVVFQSFASDLDPNDTNEISDIFVRDLKLGTTERVSVTPSGEQAEPPNGALVERATYPINEELAVNRNPGISADGRTVAFMSQSPNLTNGTTDPCSPGCGTVVVVDRIRKTSRLACIDKQGRESRYICRLGSVSSTGRYIVFESAGDGFADGDEGSVRQVYIRDMVAQRTELVSVNDDGDQADREAAVRPGDYYAGARHISRDGRWVVFSSFATNLTPDDDDVVDVYVRDRLAKTTRRVTPPLGPEESTTTAVLDAVTIADDGAWIAFASTRQLVPEDDNTWADVYLRSQATAVLLRVSVGQSGGSAGGRNPALSQNGALAFVSSERLDSADADQEQDIYVRRIPEGLH